MTHDELKQAMDDVLNADQGYLGLREIKSQIIKNTRQTPDDASIKAIIDRYRKQYISDVTGKKWMRNTEDQ